MKPRQIISFLALFLLVTATMQSLVELAWVEFNGYESFFRGVFHNLTSLFFSLIVSIPVTVLILKKYEKNGQ
jgi:hypothetical protein